MNVKNLDDPNELVKHDKTGILTSIKNLFNQINQSYSEVKDKNFKNIEGSIDNVVISGMGGSALGGRVIDSLLAGRSLLPIEVYTEYHLPSYVSKNSLVILSSYSGNTEETINDTYEAIKKNAKLLVITTGGKLKNIIEKNNIDSYIFDPIYNKSNQPRMALGYSVGALLSVLSRCGVIPNIDEEVKSNLNMVREIVSDFDIESPTQRNIAKSMAGKIKGYLPIFVSSEHLIGSTHFVKNQINETAKCFSAMFDIPELNHHLMEGLKHPGEIKTLFKFIFIESGLYSDRVIKRYPITKEVIEKNSISYLTYKLQSKNKMGQVFELTLLGEYIAYYLSYLNNEDPSVIPWVDYFKAKL